MSPGACSINDLRYALIHAAAMFQHVRKNKPKAEWAIASEAMRARGIIVLVKSNLLVKNFETKVKARL